ncbi:DNA polymerase III subunit chi [Tepidiphilus succinatimandens]|uniref:DNA polymerase III subunit chi n=1 Tax=Tepidiphilus succinatimandens TaxID=224436 RepID=UPI00112F7C6A|nr:DNA polymerase III subunit chi [Tepidiphilus succinatimandens]
MAHVRFYYDVPEPLALAHELVARAYRAGQEVAVRLEDEAALATFAQRLWTHQAGDFLPNVPASSPLAEHTPIVLLPAAAPLPPRPVLIQLARSYPEADQATDWILEVVSAQESDKAPARERFRRYRAEGHDVQAIPRKTPTP